MTRPRRTTPEHRDQVHAVRAAVGAGPQRTCRPGIRGHCGDPACAFCQRDREERAELAEDTAAE